MNHDNVSHPQHYTAQGAFECIEIMELIFNNQQMFAFCLLNAFKYLWRCEHKGKKEEDLKKAEWYLLRATHYNDQNTMKDWNKHHLLERKLRQLDGTREKQATMLKNQAT